MKLIVWNSIFNFLSQRFNFLICDFDIIMADKALVSTQTGTPRKICIRNWPVLCVGGIFCSGGFGWCLHTALKERPENWKTTLAAFFVGATGITITHTVLFDAYRYARQGRRRKDTVFRHLTKVDVHPVFKTGLENLKLPESLGLKESDAELYEEVCQALVKKIAEAKETECISCWSLCISVYEALHEFKMGYVKCTSTPELSDSLQKALMEYKIERGCRDVAEQYRTAISARLVEFQAHISSNFKEFGTYVEYLLLKRELPPEVQSVSIVSEDVASKFSLAQDLSEESIQKVVEMVSNLTLSLNRNFDAELSVFISSVYKTLNPPIQCPTELEFKRQIERALFQKAVQFSYV